MDRLSVELIHIICSSLQTTDVGQLRCTSKFYASVGRPHMFRHLHLMFTPESFKRLHKISSDPTLAPYVKSLFYEADTLPVYRSYSDWQQNLIDPAISSSLRSMHQPGPDSTGCTFRAIGRELEKIERLPRHSYSPAQLSTAYRKYRKYSKQQVAMRRGSHHARQITKAMARLPNLEYIRVSLEGWARRSHKFENVYRDSYVYPSYTSTSRVRLGVPQVLSLLRGSAQTETKLKQFCAGVVDWTFFSQSDEVFADLQKGVRNLQDLSMQFATTWKLPCIQFPTTRMLPYRYLGYGEALYASEIDACADYLRNGRLREFLAAAPNLRKLSLKFDWSDLTCPADLRDVVGMGKWEFLANVTLSSFDSRAEDLWRFCERHTKTLRRLVLDNIKLLEGSWAPTFQEMRRLLHLEQVNIRGDLEAFEFEELWSFSFLWAPDETTMTRAVQEYLLQGGDGPLLDLSEYNTLTAFETGTA